MIEDPAATARNRFIIIQFVRIGATVGTLIGLLVWQTDLLREGGSAAIGIPIALIGLLGSFAMPQWLIRKWRTPPGQ